MRVHLPGFWNPTGPAPSPLEKKPLTLSPAEPTAFLSPARTIRDYIDRIGYKIFLPISSVNESIEDRLTVRTRFPTTEIYVLELRNFERIVGKGYIRFQSQ
jgi:hypothetical protein